MAKAINADLVRFDLWGHPRLVRYPLGIWKTFRLLSQQRPDALIVQNPSFVLALFAIFGKRIFGFTVGVDTHNSGFGLYRNSRLLHRVLRFIQREADFTIAHNEPLRRQVARRGGKVIAVPDPLPEIPELGKLRLSGGEKVLYICSFKEDEPYREVLKAARRLPPDVQIFFTGNFTGRIDPGSVPDTVSLLGWVSWETYNRLLYSVDVIMDLTFRENCLLCGAYEAVAAACPLITSDTRALREYFSRGVIYTGHHPAEIATSVHTALANRAELKKEISRLRWERHAGWSIYRDRLLALL